MICKTRRIFQILAIIGGGLVADGTAAAGNRDGANPVVGPVGQDTSLAGSRLAGLMETRPSASPRAAAALLQAAARRDCRIQAGDTETGVRRRRCVQRSPYNFGNLSDNNFDPLLTPDGRFVVFTSRENLDDDPADVPASTEDTASFDIFRQNLRNGVLQRVSVDADGNLAPPVPIPEDFHSPGPLPDESLPAVSARPAISANGRLVAFATNGAFAPEDSNNDGDVYLKNLNTGGLTLVSATARGAAAGGVPVQLLFQDQGREVAMSDNGRFVAFMTTVALKPGRDRNDLLDVYVRNLKTNRLFIASIDDQGRAGGVADADSFAPSPIDISADGRFVAFTTTAALDPADDNDQADVYVWDRRRSRTTPVLASIGAAPPPGFDGFRPLSSHPGLSADGRFVVFQSSAALLPEDSNGVNDIYSYERLTGRTSRISLDRDGRETAVAGSFSPVISANGRFVAFSSAAGDLVLGDTSFGFTDRSDANAPQFPEDIFVKDLQTGAITRASLDDDGIETDGTSFSPTLSANGTLIAFMTDDAGILDPLSVNDRPGDSVVVSGVDFAALPVDDVPGTPEGAVSVERNFGSDPSDFFTFRQPNPNVPLNFALRNTIEQPDDQDWFSVALFAGRDYEIDLEGSQTGQGTLDDPLLRIFRAQASGEDPEPGPTDDDGGEGFNARLFFQPTEDGTYFISAESLGAATGTYRLLVREVEP